MPANKRTFFARKLITQSLPIECFLDCFEVIPQDDVLTSDAGVTQIGKAPLIIVVQAGIDPSAGWHLFRRFSKIARHRFHVPDWQSDHQGWFAISFWLPGHKQSGRFGYVPTVANLPSFEAAAQNGQDQWGQGCLGEYSVVEPLEVRLELGKVTDAYRERRV